MRSSINFKHCVFGICYVVMFLSDFAVSQTDNSQLDILLQNVNNAVSNKDYMLAETECVNAIKNYPNSKVELVAHRELAKLNLYSNNLKSTVGQIEIIKNRFSDDPDTNEALFLIAKELTQSAHYDEALELHAYNSQRYPDTQFGMISQVKIIKSDFQEKNYSSVHNNIDKLIAKFSQQKGITKELYKLGHQFVDARQQENAIKLFQYNVEHPLSSEYAVKSRLGIFEIEALDGKNSEWIIKELNTIKSSFSNQDSLPADLYSTAKYLRKKAKSSFACTVDEFNAKQFSGTKYGMYSHVEVIYYHIHNKRYEKAEELFRNFIDTYKESPSFMKQAGNIVGQYAKRGLLVKVEPLCQAALAAQPGHKDTILFEKSLIQIALDRGDFKKAEDSLNEFIESNQANPGYFRQAYSLGWDFQRHSKYSIALQVYDQLLTNFENHKEIGRIPYYQARAYLELGQVEKSMEYVDLCFTKYIDWKPMARKMLETGCLYSRFGYKEQAMEILKKVLEEHPKKMVGSDLALSLCSFR